MVNFSGRLQSAGRVEGPYLNVDGAVSPHQTSTSPSNAQFWRSVLSDVRSIAAGDGQTLAVRNDGTPWTWGGNRISQQGNGAFAYATQSCPPFRYRLKIASFDAASGSSSEHWLPSGGALVAPVRSSTAIQNGPATTSGSPSPRGSRAGARGKGWSKPSTHFIENCEVIKIWTQAHEPEVQSSETQLQIIAPPPNATIGFG